MFKKKKPLSQSELNNLSILIPYWCSLYGRSWTNDKEMRDKFERQYGFIGRLTWER